VAARDDISNAASTVAGIACSPKYRQTTETGHAFVQLDHIEYPNRFGGIVFWRVYVMLPADRNEAEQFTEDKALPLYNALRPQMVVTAIRAQDTQFDLGGPALPTLVIEGTREQE
jgi:hypothetical protein